MRAGLGPGDAGPGAGHLMAGLPRRIGGIMESGEQGRSGKQGQNKERRVTPLTIQTHCLNRCESF